MLLRLSLRAQHRLFRFRRRCWAFIKDIVSGLWEIITDGQNSMSPDQTSPNLAEREHQARLRAERRRKREVARVDRAAFRQRWRQVLDRLQNTESIFGTNDAGDVIEYIVNDQGEIIEQRLV